MTTFQVNQTYAVRSICDHNAIWTFTVISRTAKTIKTACGKTLRINDAASGWNNSETVYPLGRYSMAPVLTADKVAA